MVQETMTKSPGDNAPQQEPAQRQIVLDAMQRRPGDPWPRWEGHAVLGEPGSPRLQKAYHEPGGGFSPSPGSFGVSVLLSTGQKPRTGDELPLVEIKQEYHWQDPGGVPGIRTTTPQYDCTWRQQGLDSWQGELRRKGGAAQLLIRSVGPAGGPIQRLDWTGNELLVNRRWVLRFDPAPARVLLGTEEEPGWLSGGNTATSVEDKDGWCYARLEMSGPEARVTIRDTAAFFASPLSYSTVKSSLQLDLPGDDFAASLQAQAANLLMGFVGRHTCPGEPTNYPLAWERDGAYSVVAMARCGQVETAKQLAAYFAENDFFGGFGAEGDAPGSAINAVATVALISGDREFQEWCWPHVKRKVTLIEQMATAKEPIRKTWIGPIVPQHAHREELPQICNAARDDLVIGSMDLHYPALYTTALSYRGLRMAQRLGQSLGREGEIASAQPLAERLQRGWHACLGRKEYVNERTYMSGLWPTWITGGDYQLYRQGLEQRWQTEHGGGTYPKRPLWTYFTVAEAHQWLLLDEPQQVWQTLRYFWQNQCSPGLYTYWEGDREENAFDLWRNIRGWVAPKSVNPHYWTAAEMLLLQVDMLAYVNEAGPQPELVIGGGVPAEWAKQRLSVTGLPTLVGIVDWSYDGQGNLDVRLHGHKSCAARVGTGFGPGAKINLRLETL
jgi:hypothetical protein